MDRTVYVSSKYQKVSETDNNYLRRRYNNTIHLFHFKRNLTTLLKIITKKKFSLFYCRENSEFSREQENVKWQWYA